MNSISARLSLAGLEGYLLSSIRYLVSMSSHKLGSALHDWTSRYPKRFIGSCEDKAVNEQKKYAEAKAPPPEPCK